ncbi:hypothetical protein M758_1G286700 [Ceratodon purpureus]|nr:hypothetical protein M758_1G286700 [Ceratodon purpureus]
MRAAARAGEFLRRKRSVAGLFSGCTKGLSRSGSTLSSSGAEVGQLRKVWDCDGRETGFRRSPSFGSRSFEQFFGRSYSVAVHVLAANMEGGSEVLRGESTESVIPMESNSGLERNGGYSNGTTTVVEGIAQGEDTKRDLVPETPGISSARVREEVELAVEAEGMKELVEGAAVEDGNLAKRLKVEAPVAVLPHAAKAWEHWNKLGAPKLMVAPMVDQSELPFRMLCRKYGATAAYSPMLHSRLFAQDVKYRTKEFSTCPEDRPLFIQFCANNPDTLLEAARFVQDDCDYVDINFGCPQRIAKRGNYGAFLMDDLPLVRSLVAKLASGLTTPVSCKIRMFPKLEDTLAYARMIEEAGCCLLAVHGRTRDQKDGKAIRADWEVIKAVKAALTIPVIANGNIRWLEDADECIRVTGVDGVMSAESLLENPALFAGYRMKPLDSSADAESDELSWKYSLDEPTLVLEYLDLCETYPVPPRMIRAHVHRMLGPWFRRYPELREELNKEHKITVEWLKDLVHRLIARHKASGTTEKPEMLDQVVSNGVAQPAQAVAAGVGAA